jgi:23S rRNA (adenine2503-C2)-methyltransferase
MSALKGRVRGPELSVDERVVSRDGTIKWRMSARGLPVETVLIPTDTRATVCVSTQSGCTRYCDFCATARMGFRGQLTAGEIVGQVLIARSASTQPVTNVVMMGMGEPLDNYEEIVQATRVLDEGLQLSPRHVTVSTSGVLPQMQRLWAETRACVALSLHATTQEARDAMMPRVSKWPLAELIGWMREASAAEGPRGRHFFIEYVLLADHNDTEADAERLVALLSGVRARVNLIPFNPSTALGIPYRRPSPERVRAFQARLVNAGILTITRETRGDDAAAACGQLAVGAVGATGATEVVT